MIVAWVVLTQCQPVTKGRTDGQTDRKTDRRIYEWDVELTFIIVYVDRLSDLTGKNSACAGRYSAVLLQIGSNDLTNSRLSVDAWIRSLRRYINNLQETYAVERVVLMEILYRKSPIRYRMQMSVDEYNRKIKDANEEMERICVPRWKMHSS